ncbi:hypothetical protein [Sulfurimonas sp. CS5]|uniref:hypothetical protein n=1 Tax=Sulfurimonas sp. CS5 TaxID=3391145 RepID=UPI0039EADA9C
MKMTLLTLLLIFITINLNADKNWIKIEDINKTQKTKSKLDLDIFQIEPVNKMIKNLKVVKQLIDSTKKEKAVTNDKNWFVVNSGDSK